MRGRRRRSDDCYEQALFRELDESRAVLQFIRDALEGRALSEFALSFGIVRDVADLRQALGQAQAEKLNANQARLIAEHDVANEIEWHRETKQDRDALSQQLHATWDALGGRRDDEGDIPDGESVVELAAALRHALAQAQDERDLAQEAAALWRTELAAAKVALAALRQAHAVLQQENVALSGACEELTAHAKYALRTTGQRTRPPLFVPSVAKRVLEIIEAALAPRPERPAP